jgi:hypothetical protein
MRMTLDIPALGLLVGILITTGITLTHRNQFAISFVHKSFSRSFELYTAVTPEMRKGECTNIAALART